MFDNIHLYIIIGIMGSITPILDKMNLEILDWSEYLFIREIIFFSFLALLVFHNKKTFSHLLDINRKQFKTIFIGSMVSVLYVCLIFKTFSLEFKKQAISKIVTIMIATTMIATFLMDKFYFNSNFTKENYIGFVFLILGIYFLKGF